METDILILLLVINVVSCVPPVNPNDNQNEKPNPYKRPKFNEINEEGKKLNCESYLQDFRKLSKSGRGQLSFYESLSTYMEEVEKNNIKLALDLNKVVDLQMNNLEKVVKSRNPRQVSMNIQVKLLENSIKNYKENSLACFNRNQFVIKFVDDRTDYIKSKETKKKLLSVRNSILTTNFMITSFSDSVSKAITELSQLLDTINKDFNNKQIKKENRLKMKEITSNIMTTIDFNTLISNSKLANLNAKKLLVYDNTLSFISCFKLNSN